MNKSLFILLLFSLSMSYAYCQVDTTRLFYAKNIESAAFVEFGSNIRQVNSSAGMDINLSVNWLVNHKYYIGAAYTQLASVEEVLSADSIGLSRPTPLYNINTAIKYQTLGVRFGYILFENQKIISFSPDLTIGWAGIKLVTDEDKQKINGALVSPALKGVFNVSDYFRIGVGVNYNAFIFKAYDSANDSSQTYKTQLTSKNLGGLGGGIFLRVGRF